MMEKADWVQRCQFPGKANTTFEIYGSWMKTNKWPSSQEEVETQFRAAVALSHPVWNTCKIILPQKGVQGKPKENEAQTHLQQNKQVWSNLNHILQSEPSHFKYLI